MIGSLNVTVRLYAVVSSSITTSGGETSGSPANGTDGTGEQENVTMATRIGNRLFIFHSYSPIHEGVSW
jgi:hypothetical protein